MDATAIFVGIDVAKTRLDRAVRPAREQWTVPNDATGIVEGIQRLHELQPRLVVLEATGG